MDSKNTLKHLNDMLFLANLENQRASGRWAQIFYELREEDLQYMLDLYISREVVKEGHKYHVLPLLGIRGNHPYTPFQVLRQFGRMKTTPREAY